MVKDKQIKEKQTRTIVVLRVTVEHGISVNRNNDEIEKRLVVKGKDGIKVMGAEVELLEF